MNRKSIQAIIMSLIFTAALPLPIVKAADGNVVRIGESDRYATAAKIATTNWNNPKDVILVCGEGYADAVSASVLSKQLDAPIVMTNSSSLNENAKNALNTLKPQNIYVIGGYSSISENIRNYLKNANYNVIELSGKNRYETNAAVAKQLVKLGMKVDKVMLVSGEGFSDALSVAPIAAAKGEILLLGTNNSSEMKSIFDFVKANNSEVTVIGTSNSINDNIYSELKAVDRINGGSNRFQTNLNVLKKFKGDLKNDKIFIANASSEDGYADALVGSSLAGKYASNLILVDGENDSATADAINYIKDNIASTADLNVIGGTGVISDNLVNKIKSNNQQPLPVDKPTVESISTNGINQVKVTFNTKVDKSTAEVLSNYEIDGTELTSSYKSKTKANIQDDKKTILITFSEPFTQLKKVDFKVKNGILDEKLSKIISEKEEQIVFSDTSQPTVNVTCRGGNKLIIRFSKPVRMDKEDLKLLKINKKSIQNFSYNNSQTVLIDENDDWADGAELYFDSTLPEGNNTITFPTGEAGSRFDTAAKVPLQGTTLSFSTQASSGIPQIKSVTSSNADTVYVTYDRPMDKVTALNDTNYKINGKTVSVNSWDISFEEGSNDSVVKIEGVGELIKKGENRILIQSDVQDTYGYGIRETDTTFNIAQDNILPQVTGISIIGNKTIRVKFNKPVTDYSATTKANYKIVDNSDASDITYKIDTITGVSNVNGYSMDTYDIKFANADELKSSSYTINIKNIYDTNTPANIMSNYNYTLDGGSGGTVKVNAVVRKSGSSRDIVIFFNRPMDKDTINNADNYFFTDGTGEIRKLPTNTEIEQSDDGKSVTITFPESYKIANGSSESYIKKIGVGNVKDENGNLLSSVSYNSDISDNYNDGPSLVADTPKLVYDGNNAVVTASVTDNLDVLDVSEFSIAGQRPDRGEIEGNTIKFTFFGVSGDNKKINALKAAGDRSYINVSSNNTGDIAGRKIKSGSYVLLLPPVTDSSSWKADSSDNSITIKFNQTIDDSIEQSYNDDFVFTNESTGKKINVTSVKVDSHNVIYRFESGSMKAGDVIDVRANDNSNNINIRGNEYGNGYYAVFSPSRDDLNIRTVVAR